MDYFAGHHYGFIYINEDETTSSQMIKRVGGPPFGRRDLGEETVEEGKWIEWKWERVRNNVVISGL